MRRRIGRNDRCWCGSGIKYKHCHLDRERQAPLHPDALAQQLRKFFEIKQCLHPLASRDTCSKIISAHTLQRMGALSHIADNTRHVLHFDPTTRQSRVDQPQPTRLGWRDASTFPGFCGSHDNETFAPLERQAFVGSVEQCFLLAYRAECHELFQKEASLRAHEPIRQVLDRGHDLHAQRVIQSREAIRHQGTTKGHAECIRRKSRMDVELLSRSYSAWRTLIVPFEGDISVVSTGVPSPNRDLRGNEIQILHDPDAPVEALYTSIVATESGGAVVFSWRPEEQAPSRFIDTLVDVPSTALASVIVQFIFAHLGNTFFSKMWWQALDQTQQRHVAQLALMSNAYYTAWKYILDLDLPWRALSFKASGLLCGPPRRR